MSESEARFGEPPPLCSAAAGGAAAAAGGWQCGERGERGQEVAGQEAAPAALLHEPLHPGHHLRLLPAARRRRSRGQAEPLQHVGHEEGRLFQVCAKAGSTALQHRAAAAAAPSRLSPGGGAAATLARLRARAPCTQPVPVERRSPRRAQQGAAQHPPACAPTWVLLEAILEVGDAQAWVLPEQRHLLGLVAPHAVGPAAQHGGAVRVGGVRQEV
jgi:hypothetical protein